MKLEDVTAKIRPRSRWESIDLGCAMARRSYGPILLAWMVCVWPLWALGVIGLGMICDGGWHVWWSFVLIWLSLGIMGRLPLHVVSRELFGEKVTAWQVIKAWPSMLFGNSWKGIFGRFSVTRGLSMPVTQLEGLKGATYKARVNLLLRNGGDGATQASLVAFLMVLVIVMSCWFFIMMVYQFYGENELMEMFFEDLTIYSEESSAGWLFLLFYAVGVTLIEPLYVGAGFAMYVNSRTLTEGWDIELSFKRLSERLKVNFRERKDDVASDVKKGKGMLLAMMGIGLTLFSSPIAEALSDSEDKSAAKKRVERILSGDEYTVHKRQEKSYKSKKKSSSSSSTSSSSSGSLFGSGSGGGASFIFEGFFLIIFWVMVVALVALLIWVIIKNKHALNKTNSLAEPDELPAVKSVMGMDVTPESLPKALSDEARDAWFRGEHHTAMSLLYRGAISWMVNQGRVPIVESDTENDCVRRVLAKDIDEGKGQFFAGLTSSWVTLAYGENLPSEAEVLEMCDHWPFEKGIKNGGLK